MSDLLPKEEEFDQFRTQCLEDEDWELIYLKDDVKVFSKKIPDFSYKAIKVKTVFEDISAKTFYEILHNHDYRKVWDDNMIEGSVVEMLRDDVEIGYYQVKLGWGVSNRDFCNMRTWKVQNDEYIIFNRSVEHDNCPERTGIIRGKSILSGYYIKKLTENSCEFIYYSHCDPKGWLPAYIVNSIMTKLAPNMIKKFHKVALEYPEWLNKKLQNE